MVAEQGRFSPGQPGVLLCPLLCKFSDHPNGQRKALQAARVYRDKLLSRLPPPKKIRIKDKRNTTGVIGVCRQEYREKSGKWFVRYIAEWPKSDGTRASASFSVNLYGEGRYL
jgi:hypothetical protein